MKISSNKVVKYLIAPLIATQSAMLYADTDWVSVTLDNDLFVGNDNGYTNGLYVSLFDTPDNKGEVPEYDFWVKPLLWSLPDEQWTGGVNTHMFGQTMSTPSDITIENPPLNELPYAAMLAYTNSYLVATDDYADMIGTTVGIVGPAALGEETQKFVHKIIGADEPLGWDTQLDNEVVFQFARARAWRSWVSDSGSADIVTHADLRAGTIISSLSTGIAFRYGEGLTESYPSVLLSGSRTTNPVAVNNGWNIYAGLNAGYIFNQIFADGNTYKDSRGVNYDREYVGISLGFAYAWENWTLTFAINDANIIQDGDVEEALEDLTQYGSLSVAWRY